MKWKLTQRMRQKAELVFCRHAIHSADAWRLKPTMGNGFVQKVEVEMKWSQIDPRGALGRDLCWWISMAEILIPAITSTSQPIMEITCEQMVAAEIRLMRTGTCQRKMSVL